MIPAESIKVRFQASDPFGGGNLRSFWPAEALKGVGVHAFAAIHGPIRREWADYDMIVIHRPLFRGNLEAVRQYKMAGLRVFIDEDDDLSRIHQTKNEIGLREWVPQAVQMHDFAMSIADGVTVSTPTLAEVYRPLNPNVKVCRNALPERFLRVRKPRLRDGKIRVGWAGIVQTHRHDLEWIAPVANTMLGGTMFTTIGDRNTPRVLKLHGVETETFPFVAEPLALYRTMARADVAIVPLLPNEFNQAKSWLKALEYLTVGVPVVTTKLPEQEKLITHGREGFLASTPEEFAGYVRMLVNDPTLRATMGEAARRRAGELVIERTVGSWLEAIRQPVAEVA